MMMMQTAGGPGHGSPLDYSDRKRPMPRWMLAAIAVSVLVHAGGAAWLYYQKFEAPTAIVPPAPEPPVTKLTFVPRPKPPVVVSTTPPAPNPPLNRPVPQPSPIPPLVAPFSDNPISTPGPITIATPLRPGPRRDQPNRPLPARPSSPSRTGSVVPAATS